MMLLHHLINTITELVLVQHILLILIATTKNAGISHCRCIGIDTCTCE